MASSGRVVPFRFRCLSLLKGPWTGNDDGTAALQHCAAPLRRGEGLHGGRSGGGSGQHRRSRVLLLSLLSLARSARRSGGRALDSFPAGGAPLARVVLPPRPVDRAVDLVDRAPAPADLPGRRSAVRRRKRPLAAPSTERQASQGGRRRLRLCLSGASPSAPPL